MTPSAEACAAAITRLPGIGPARVLSMLRGRDPRDVWGDVIAGRITRAQPTQPDLLGASGARTDRSWTTAAGTDDPEQWWDAARARGARVTWIGRDDYPGVLAGDPHPPGVLFWRGSLAFLEQPRVAIVGTRTASPEGRAVAHDMARGLVAEGVCVLSGLALGIDGSAHAGALSVADRDGDPAGAPTVGVAASGVDVPYPKRHAALWERVAEAGAVISETPPGQPAQAWRFPARNRIIAALSQLVVVVESHAAGGSLITAEAAIARGVEVRVVPGPVSSPCNQGSNQLLYEGAGPVRNATDVLDALGMFLPGPHGPDGTDRAAHGGRHRTRKPGRLLPRLDPSEAAVLRSLGWTPATINKVAERSALPVQRVAVALEALAARGLVEDHRGWWRRIRG